MRKKLVRLFAIFIAFSMMVLVVEPVRATTISDLEKEKQELEQKKKEADEKKKQEQTMIFVLGYIYLMFYKKVKE